MRVYEELFIIRPDATDEEIDPVVEQLSGVVTNGGGTVDKVDKWGVRKLAYRVQKRNEGYYVLMQFTAGPDSVKEIERRLRVSDLVLKFITVRIDEKLKKIEKRRKEREKRAARKPQVAAPPPALPGAGPVPGAPAPGAPAPGVPGAPAAPAPGAPVPAAPAPAAPAPAAPAPAAPAPAPATGESENQG
jgi:small subunit ribosomal protein S6